MFCSLGKMEELTSCAQCVRACGHVWVSDRRASSSERACAVEVLAGGTGRLERQGCAHSPTVDGEMASTERSYFLSVPADNITMIAFWSDSQNIYGLLPVHFCDFSTGIIKPAIGIHPQ